MIKEIYSELLQNRAHLLSELEIKNLEKIFEDLYTKHSGRKLGFTPAFKKQYDQLDFDPSDIVKQ